MPLLKGSFDPALHPHAPGGSPEGGQFISTGGGDGGGASEKPDYGLVPGDVEKFKQLKSDWAKINNDLLAHVDDPDGPESRAAIDKLEAISKAIHGLHADPGGPAGIGLPGGPRDVTIVGAGPGGLAASINGAAEGLDTLVVEANVVAGGQAKFSSRIENFPGFPIGVTGERLTQNMFEQAHRLGAESKLGVRVTGMTYDAKTGLKHIELSNGEHIESRTVILAGGLEFRSMSFPGSEGPGVIVGDGKALAKAGAGGNVCVIGGSNGAAQAALGCARNCDHVYLLARSPIVGSMSDYQITALKNNPKITVIEGDSIAKLDRDEHGNPQRMETGKGQVLEVKAIGAFVGSVPDTKWVPAEVTLAKGGRVKTNSDLETPLPGVFAVGDVRDGAIGRVGVAVGEGQLALRQANVFLDAQRKQAQGKSAKPSGDTSTLGLITRLFDLDRDNPWFGQTVDGVTPLPTPTKATPTKAGRPVMPLKPNKGESQSDFISRCMSEVYGDNAPKDRTQEQAVAICHAYWRGEHGGEPPPAKGGESGGRQSPPVGDGKKQAKQYDDMDCDPPADDESYDDFMDRCSDSMDEDSCQMMWDDAQQERAAPRRAVIHKTHSGDVQGMEFVLSDETIDRMGDIISSEGWVLDSFQKNPIALFNHNSDFPIGRWHNLRIDNNSLRGHLQLAPEGTSDRIDEIRKLVEAGILCSVSVGFSPIESEPLKSAGLWPCSKYTKQELLETSLVSVPANPNALAVAKSLGISPATIDVIFAKHGKQADIKRRDFTAKHGDTSRNGKDSKMSSLSQRILDLQQQIANKLEELDAHVGKQDDSNVSDADLEKTTLLNAQVRQLRNQHAALTETEALQAADVEQGGTHRRSMVPASLMTGTANVAAPMIIKHSKKDWEPLDYLVHAGVCVGMSKIRGTMPDLERLRIYGEDEPHKVVLDWVMRAPSAPALTTVAGWAQELVHQIYADLLGLLMAQSIYPRLSAKGTSLSFGQAGKILLPSRSRTPTVAGSFVGEGMAIPVRQGAFTSQTFTPKKMAVITSWSREMADHSIPAIEGVLREAIQQDTAISLDSVLLDANPATVIRPAGILNGVSALTQTAGGGIAAVIGDIKQLTAALVAATYGNIRNPVWLMNPSDALSASLATAANTGIFPFKDEIGRGTLNNVPIIDSATVPAKTVILTDAADFVAMQGDNVRFEISDQATLHMEDTTPLDLVSGSPGVVASPQRSLFQTDSLALRMVFPVNWAFRRTGMLAWVANVTW